MKILYPFQEDAVTRIIDSSGFILADECGLGKTVTTIEAVKDLGLVDPWRVLVVCPPSLITQWQDAIADQDPNAPVLVVDKTPYDPMKITGWILASYFELGRPALRALFYSHVWDVVVLDEAHRIKNRKTKLFQSIRQISKAKGIALTATPMERTIADMWALLNFIAPFAFPSFWSFVERYVTKTPGYMEHWVLGGPKDPEEFGRILKPHMLRRTKEDVMPQLPEKIVIDVHVPMDPAQAKIYATIKTSDDVIVNVATGGAAVVNMELFIPNALAYLTRLQQVSTDPTLLNFDIQSGKIMWLSEFLSDHPEPVVVFTRFRHTAEWLAIAFEMDLIVGGEQGTRFTNGTANRLVGTIDAMGEGLNLQRAKNAIFLDCHWSTIKMTQAIDRIHRMDIKEAKNIYRLYSCREDLLVLEALEHKWTEGELVYYMMQDTERLPK